MSTDGFEKLCVLVDRRAWGGTGLCAFRGENLGSPNILPLADSEHLCIQEVTVVMELQNI